MSKEFVTLQEIYQQPEMWQSTYDIVKDQKEKIDEFINFTDSKVRVIFTGGGTSNYIGDVIYNYLNKKNYGKFEFYSYPSPSIMSAPEDYLIDEPTLLVNFARSGNSPESLASVNIANELLSNVRHLYITCAKDGNLAKNSANDDKSYAVILDEKTNDKGFAMTSSASSMLLAALIIFDKDFNQNRLNEIIDLAKTALTYEDKIKEIVNLDYDRVVYLGSGALSFMTAEASLKVLELTAGAIATLHDSSAGFRHGPKSFLNEKTLVFNYISNDDYTSQYDLDMIHEIKNDKIVKRIFGIGSSRFEESDLSFNISKDLPDAYLSIVYLILGQLFAYRTAIKIDNDVDNPSATGTVNRVVKGVTVHPLKKWGLDATWKGFNFY